MFGTSVCALCVVSIFMTAYVSSQMSPLSPCPRVFSYVNDGQTWHGIITVGPPYDTDLRLNLKMDVPHTLPSRYLGRIDMLGERSEVAFSLTNGRNLRYKVEFPTLDYIPAITSITLNGNEICSGPRLRGSVTSVELKHVLNTNLNNVYRGYQGSGLQPQPQPVYNEFPNPVFQSENTPQRVPLPNNQNVNPGYTNPYLNNAYGNSKTVPPIRNDQFLNENLRPVNPWLNSNTIEYQNSYGQNNANIQQNYGQPTPWPQNDYKQPITPRTERAWMTRPTRPTTVTEPAVNFVVSTDERPNPDTFALYNRRTTTTIAPNMPPENDREETRKKCGISRKTNSPLIVGGDQTEKGDWPWLAAIFVKRVSSLNFQCGGTLISKEFVITAAHCLGQNNNRRVRKEELIIRLGVHNMEDWTDPDTKSFPVIDLILPPAFEGGLVLKNDIVLLKMNRISYDDYILPACLWSESIDVTPFYGTFGTIVGWGRNENGIIASSEPRSTKQKIVTTDECRDSNPAFDTLASSTTLCAGNRNGTGPCNGDSGGGIFINVNGKWTLRGLLSTGISNPNSSTSCNLDEFLVYTDVAKFLPWINYYL